jgi:hypothetical protein
LDFSAIILLYAIFELNADLRGSFDILDFGFWIADFVQRSLESSPRTFGYITNINIPIPHGRDAMVFASFCQNKKKEELFIPALVERGKWKSRLTTHSEKGI